MSSESNINKLTFNQMSENKYSSLIPVEGEFYVTPDYINLPLLTSMWFDHIVNDISWLRSDTFAWQSGDVYTAVYNHLVSDISGKSASSETVGGVTISYYLADDGHKITTDETSVVNIYTATGVAWYYILDTTNHRFKLPRTKFGFTGLRDNVGNYVAPGLPNHTHYIANYDANGQSSGGGYIPANSFNVGSVIVNSGVNGESGNGNWTDRGGTGFSTNRNQMTYASSDNSLYGSSTTVQPPATQMYLYFYVGNFTNSAIEQTAGITTAALNNKMDVDFNNSGPISDTFKTRLNTAGIRYVKESWQSGTSWYRVWSDNWIEQGGQFTKTSNPTTCTFHKPFSDTNYYINASQFDYNSSSSKYEKTSYTSKSTSSIGVYMGSYNAQCTNTDSTLIYWYACGY